MAVDEVIYEQEIRITDVLVRILSAWKKILVVACIGAVLLAGYIVLVTLKQGPTLVMTDGEIAEANVRIEEIEALLSEKEAALESNEEALFTTESSIDTNEMLMLDKKNEIERIELSIEKSKDLEEIYQTMVDAMITENIAEENYAASVMSYIVKLAETQESIYVKETRIVTLNKEIRDLKKENEINIPKKIEKIEEQIKVIEEEIGLISEEYDELTFQMGEMIIQELDFVKVVVVAFLGFILGIGLGCGCIVVIMIFDNRIHNTQILEDGFGLCLLGTISDDEGKKGKGIISKVIDRMKGVNHAYCAAEEKNVIVEKIKAFSRTNKVMAIGTVNVDNIEFVGNELKEVAFANGLDLISAGNPMYSSEALKRIKDYELILVEKIDETDMKELEKLIRFLNKSEATILGVVIG